MRTEAQLLNLKTAHLSSVFNLRSGPTESSPTDEQECLTSYMLNSAQLKFEAAFDQLIIIRLASVSSGFCFCVGFSF